MQPIDHASLVVQFLRDHPAPCPTCRYNLAGVNSDRCPECGVVLTLMLKDRPRRRDWAWPVVALVSLMLTSVLALVRTVNFLGGAFASWSFLLEVGLNTIVLMTCALAFVRAHRFRRQLRLQEGVRTLNVAVCCAVLLLQAVWLAMMLIWW